MNARDGAIHKQLFMVSFIGIIKQFSDHKILYLNAAGVKSNRTGNIPEDVEFKELAIELHGVYLSERNEETVSYHPIESHGRVTGNLDVRQFFDLNRITLGPLNCRVFVCITPKSDRLL